MQIKSSSPLYAKEALSINRSIAKLDKKSISLLMDISPKLTEQVCGFIRDFCDSGNRKPAILMYSGVVYKQLNTKKLKFPDFEFANKTIRTISGLYGILRPLDLIAPYRLEMGANLQIEKGQVLYEFWQDKVTAAINKDAIKFKAKCVLNLASKEYSQAVKQEILKIPFINVDFKEKKGSKLKTVGLLAKVARGKMAKN